MITAYIFIGGYAEMDANINYIGILNLIHLLMEAGIITEIERRQLARYIAMKTGTNIVIPIASF